MKSIDLVAADLNLLVVLDVLLEERNVTRAARRLHRTQSATSHALARLRDLLGDPILVRVGGRMRPTPRAERLAPEVGRLLATIGRVLAEEGAFDPRRSERAFTLAAPDFVGAALPGLVARMGAAAPGTTVELVGATRGLLGDVAEGRWDVAVAPIRRAEGVKTAPLVALEWAVFARADHPAAAAWSARAWGAYPHLRVRTSSDAESPVDVAARARGLPRRRGPVIPHFSLAPPLLARTDLLLTVPRAVLAGVAPQHGLVALPCPVKLPPIELALAWSAQLDRDPANTWFRQVVQAAVIEAFAPRRRARR